MNRVSLAGRRDATEELAAPGTRGGPAVLADAVAVADARNAPWFTHHGSAYPPKGDNGSVGTEVEAATDAVKSEQSPLTSGVAPEEQAWRRWAPCRDGAQPIMDRLLIERGGTL